MSARLTVLIIGGYGTFGGRLVELLESEPRLTLIVAGRSRERAAAYCARRLTARARLLPVAFDRDGDVTEQLAALRPDICVDASGPFQAYGTAPYRLVEACITLRINYLDLADGADFVNGIHAFDADASRAGIWILSGVSSFPVLTAAVVRELASGMTAVTDIHAGIAPSPHAGVGLNVIRAIASYAGQGVSLKRDGRTVTGYPLTEHMRFTIAVAGRMPLRSTLFSLMDVPDLRALAELWPGARTIWIGAGPVPEILHRALSVLAWIVRLGIIRSLAPLAPLLHFASNHLTWGEHRGGMFIRVRGHGAGGGGMTRTWSLLAEGDDGPLIPSMAVEALVRKAICGDTPSPGARPAVRELKLADYDALFSSRTIYTSLTDDHAEAASLYERILGPAWPSLPAEVRAMHDVQKTVTVHGRASVDRGGNAIAWLIAAVIGFPKAGEDIPVSVEFRASGGVETWTRTFAGRRFHSFQFAGMGRSEALLCERFGWFTFAMALVADEEGRLRLVPRRWSLFGLPLPMWLCPRTDSYERSENGKFRFHVEISHPLAGLIVRYQGWLDRPT